MLRAAAWRWAATTDLVLISPGGVARKARAAVAFVFAMAGWIVLSGYLQEVPGRDGRLEA
jgi:hypothetical protein